MKYFATLLFASLVFVACTNTNADKADVRKPANDIEANILRDGDSMMAAFKRKDWNTYIKYNHPNMVKMIGGHDAFYALVQQQLKQIPDQAIKSLSIGKVQQVVKTPTDQQCVVEQNLLMVLDSVQITSTTYLIGESVNDGKSWTFFDATSGGLITPKDIKANISPALKVPAKKQDIKKI